ncbi:MAG: hypothetical protein HUU47_00650 [Bacteroidetes bacterium]|nr:hypothetical protein [Bacteroidota bacterium]
MNVLKQILLILSFATIIFTYESCKKEDDLQNERQTVIDDYNNIYLATAVANPGWTGSTNGCIAGRASQQTNEMVIKRINYFRKLVGLNYNTTLDTSKFEMYQQAALMMKANYQLSHNPPNSWTCWTQKGFDGAKTSNLSLGSHSTGAITSFINDFGSNNKPCGHRRWILHSTKTQFSYGTTDKSMSLGTIGFAGGNTVIPPFIAYPPKGFVPQTLVFARWSFGIPGANFANATVSMSGPFGAVILNVVSKTDNGYGDNTIVWEPVGINTSSIEDIEYTVTINGVENAPEKSYTYTVTLIKI